MAVNRKGGLGRGLDALIAPPKPSQYKPAANTSKNDNVLDSYDMYLLRAHMIDLITISQE